MSDIVERLRRSWPRPKDGAIGDLHEAADTIEELCDKIEGLVADLDSAIEVAFKRGATEWVRMNYPDHYKRLTAAV